MALMSFVTSRESREMTAELNWTNSDPEFTLLRKREEGREKRSKGGRRGEGEGKEEGKGGGGRETLHWPSGVWR